MNTSAFLYRVEHPGAAFAGHHVGAGRAQAAGALLVVEDHRSERGKEAIVVDAFRQPGNIMNVKLSPRLKVRRA